MINRETLNQIMSLGTLIISVSLFVIGFSIKFSERVMWASVWFFTMAIWFQVLEVERDV